MLGVPQYPSIQPAPWRKYAASHGDESHSVQGFAQLDESNRDELCGSLIALHNGFAKWLSFGGEGVISTNNRDELRQIIKYNHLIANCLIFYNVVEMSRILNDLMQEGIGVEPEAIAALSPF